MHRGRGPTSAGLGLSNILGDQISLPGKVEYPTPALPNPLPGTNNVNITSNSGACAALGFTGVTSGWCTTSGSGSSQKVTIDSGGAPVWLPNVSIGSQVMLEIVAHWAPAQIVYINSLDLTGGGTIAVKATASNQSVLVHLVGKNADGTNMATVMDFGGLFGGSFTNTSTCTDARVRRVDAAVRLRRQRPCQFRGTTRRPRPSTRRTGRSSSPALPISTARFSARP